MPRRLVDLRAVPLLDIASHGRCGPGQPPLSKAEIEYISRTVRRVPEVMIKVTGGARSLRGVESHLDYIGREGRGEIETDDAQQLQERGIGRELARDWDLDIDENRRHTERAVAAGRKPPRLVHNLVFSMPKGTPPDKLYEAVRQFAMEKFALQHRYAMALHTEQGHPHVHVVVKAVSEQGERLYIRKATLREWRRDFAKYLRDLGVEANATERAVRGQTSRSKTDGIYRALHRGESTHMRGRVEGVARELAHGGLAPERGSEIMLATRLAVARGWERLAKNLEREGQGELADLLWRFVDSMPPVRTDRQAIAEALIARMRQARSREAPLPPSR
jgi:MobA/VirD2-like, nuclease domain